MEILRQRDERRSRIHPFRDQVVCCICVVFSHWINHDDNLSKRRVFVDVCHRPGMVGAAMANQDTRLQCRGCVGVGILPSNQRIKSLQQRQLLRAMVRPFKKRIVRTAILDANLFPVFNVMLSNLLQYQRIIVEIFFPTIGCPLHLFLKPLKFFPASIPDRSWIIRIRRRNTFANIAFGFSFLHQRCEVLLALVSRVECRLFRCVNNPDEIIIPAQCAGTCFLTRARLLGGRRRRLLHNDNEYTITIHCLYSILKSVPRNKKQN